MKSCRRRQSAIVAVALLWSIPVLAQAQNAGQGFGQGSGQGSRMSNDSPNDPSTLLTAEAVQKELALTDDQKARLQKLRNERTAEGQAFFAKFMGLPQSEMERRMEERAKESRQNIAKILTPDQSARLDEINIQVVGIAALGFESVAEKIGLTDGQKIQLKNLADETGRRLVELFPTNQTQLRDPKARQERRKKQDEIKAERNDKALAILTEEQKSKFEKLKGEKFDIGSIRVTNESFRGSGKTEAPTGVPAS
jgi:Spy/CpxP family protein refolding chaperone